MRKRVVFSWIRDYQGRVCKAFIAVVADREDWEEVIAGNLSKKKFFDERILPRVLKTFPTMYRKVRKRYSDGGRSLTEDEFKVILYGRFSNMFDISKAKKRLLRSKEHPRNTGKEEMERAYRIARKIYKKQCTWETRKEK